MSEQERAALLILAVADAWDGYEALRAVTAAFAAIRADERKAIVAYTLEFARGWGTRPRALDVLASRIAGGAHAPTGAEAGEARDWLEQPE